MRKRAPRCAGRGSAILQGMHCHTLWSASAPKAGNGTRLRLAMGRVAERHRILIVEDEEAIGKYLQKTLSSHGYDAFAVASTAQEAMERANEKRPDLVLMDIHIQGDRDGIATAQLF